jgi:beta-xylosidase
MRKISKKSKEIIEFINQGKLQFEIRKLGYKNETVRYYWRKIKNPEGFKKSIKKIQKLNQKRLSKQG